MSIKVIGAALCGGLVSLAAQAANTDTKPAKKPAAQATHKAVEGTQSDMRAYIDPESGQLVNAPVTAEQAREASKSKAGPDLSKIDILHKADGSTEYVFNGQVEENMVATRTADGKVQVKCAEHGVVHDDATLAEETRNDR